MGIRDRLACGLLVLAALVAATWTILNGRAGLVPLTGGIGAVSSDLGFELIVLFGLLLVNTLLAGAARRHSPLAERTRMST